MSKPKKPSKEAMQRGRARAEAMSPEGRKESARHAAKARWAKTAAVLPRLPKETHAGVLEVANALLPCAVLDSTMRVFTQRGIMGAFGIEKPSGGRGAAEEDGAAQLPGFLGSKAVFPFLSESLVVSLRTPIVFVPRQGGRTAYGYEVTILSAICDALLEARKAGTLTPQQRHIADQAEVLVRAFARVGIIALVDEATGYQADRARDELQKILAHYIAAELLPWTKKFPDEFFKQVYKIHGWKYEVGNSKRPQYIGKIINKYVYDKLPPGVLEELRAKNPPIDGRRKFKHFQWLTNDTGHPHLDRQIVKVTTLLQVSDSPAEFERHFKKAFPKPGQQIDLALTDGKDKE